jgi:hypothetical protein
MERATMHEYGLRRTSTPLPPPPVPPSAPFRAPPCGRTSFSLFAICHPRSNPARARAWIRRGRLKRKLRREIVSARKPPTDNAEFLKRTRRGIPPPWRRQRRRRRRWSSNPAAGCLVRRAREFPRRTIDAPADPIRNSGMHVIFAGNSNGELPRCGSTVANDKAKVRLCE